MRKKYVFFFGMIWKEGTLTLFIAHSSLWALYSFFFSAIFPPIWFDNVGLYPAFWNIWAPFMRNRFSEILFWPFALIRLGSPSRFSPLCCKQLRNPKHWETGQRSIFWTPLKEYFVACKSWKIWQNNTVWDKWKQMHRSSDISSDRLPRLQLSEHDGYELVKIDVNAKSRPLRCK